MDKVDSQVLKALQNEFTLSERPYETIASKLDIQCSELWKRIEKLVDEGIIRRLGASLNSHKLGFCSTLAAINVQANLVERATEVIDQFPEITHSYLRKDHFNIWFTVIASDNERIEQVLEQISSSLSLESAQLINLPVKKLFKLDARFNISP